MGFGFIFAWRLVVLLWEAPSYPLDLWDPWRLLRQIIFLLGCLSTAIVLSWKTASVRISKMFNHRITYIAAFVVCLAPSILGSFGPDASGFRPLFNVLLFLSGAVSNLMFSEWEAISLEIESRNLVLFTGYSCILGAGFYILARIFLPDYDLIISVCLLLLSIAMQTLTKGHIAFEEVGRDDRESFTLGMVDIVSPAPTKAEQTLRRKTSALYILFSACFGLGWGMLTIMYQPVGLILPTIAIGVCLVIIVRMHLTERVMSLEMLETSCFALIIIGMIVVSGSRFHIATYIGFSFVIVAWFLFRSLSQGLLLRQTLERSVSATSIFAVTQISTSIGIPIGWAIAMLMSYFGDDGNAINLCSAIISIVMLVLALFRFPLEQPQQHDFVQEAEENSPSRNFTVEVLIVAEHYHLSPRESEILCYLARGYSAKHIAETLTLSEHTVKTHTYRIYQKMNVHTKQELVTLVESFVSASDSSNS